MSMFIRHLASYFMHIQFSWIKIDAQLLVDDLLYEILNILCKKSNDFEKNGKAWGCDA